MDYNQEEEYNIDEKTQKLLNTPLSGGVEETHISYLHKIIDLIDKSIIDLKDINSVINKDLYEGCDLETQKLINMTAMNLLSNIERLLYLKDKNFKETYQTKYIVERIWNLKENIESKYGDIFIL